MSLHILRVALQGLFDLNPIQVAVQGLLDQIASGKTIFQDTDQGVAGKKQPARDYYVEWANREFERKLELERDDVLATEFVMALVQTEILYA